MPIEPRQPTAKGPAKWFTGDVFIDPVAQGHAASPITVGLVHFTPGARTAWHAHEVGQTLYVTEGNPE
jgi:quercetin dioxygenase-like cupin family protein